MSYAKELLCIPGGSANTLRHSRQPRKTLRMHSTKQRKQSYSTLPMGVCKEQNTQTECTGVSHAGSSSRCYNLLDAHIALPQCLYPKLSDGQRLQAQHRPGFRLADAWPRNHRIAMPRTTLRSIRHKLNLLTKCPCKHVHLPSPHPIYLAHPSPDRPCFLAAS